MNGATVLYFFYLFYLEEEVVWTDLYRKSLFYSCHFLLYFSFTSQLYDWFALQKFVFLCQFLLFLYINCNFMCCCMIRWFERVHVLSVTTSVSFRVNILYIFYYFFLNKSWRYTLSRRFCIADFFHISLLKVKDYFFCPQDILRQFL